MRIAFAGTPPFAATALAALLAAGFEVPLVLTQPDRPAGRGMKLTPSAVRALAAAHAIDVATPASLSLARGGADAAAAHERIAAARADVLVVAAYGLILPAVVLAIPAGLPASTGPIRAVNIHASLLPRWRGAAPVARAIEAGDAQTGTTIMQMDAGLDTGPILLAEPLPIGADDDAGTLTARLAAQGAVLVVRALHEAAAGRLAARPQPDAGACYAAKLERREAWLDWSLGAAPLARKVMAFNPYPGAAALWNGATVKLWRAHAAPGATDAPCGTVLDAAGADGLPIACGDGSVLRVTELQRAGGRRMPAREFCAGAGLRAGDRLRRPDDDARAA